MASLINYSNNRENFSSDGEKRTSIIERIERIKIAKDLILYRGNEDAQQLELRELPEETQQPLVEADQARQPLVVADILSADKAADSHEFALVDQARNDVAAALEDGGLQK